MKINCNRSWLLIPAVSGLLFSGCALKRDSYDVPVAPLASQFKNSDALSLLIENQSTANGNQTQDMRVEALLNEWWHYFNNNELNQLVDQALANNNDLRIALLRISQSQARSDQAYAGQFPEVAIVGQGHHDAPSNGVNSYSGYGTLQQRQYAQIGPSANWRVDLWGELKSLAEAGEREAWATTYQRDNTRRLLIANVVAQYVEYLSLNDRLRVANDTKAALENLLEAVNQRLKFGDATIIELEQQRAEVLTVKATIPGLELQRETVANALAQLLGVTPGVLVLSQQGIDSLQLPAIQAVVPSNLLLRRPDVRAVESRLLAADANIDVARARVLPPLDITAQAGWGVLALGHLVNPYGPLYNVAANLSATIFDYGKRMNEVAFARAMHEEMVETYIRVIYGAVRETEDALVNTNMNGKRLEAQQLATEASLHAWKSSQDSFSGGDIDFLILLDTERTYYRNLDEYHRVRMERYQGLVNLFTSLGGGVPQGDTLPGEGKRPDGSKPSPVANSVLSDTGIVWDEPDSDKEFWLVQLAGLQDKAGVGHVWRDMQQRFTSEMKNHVLMPREEGRMEDSGQERIHWYRLFVAQFSTENEATSFCQTLNRQLVRCNVVSSESDDFLKLLAEKPKDLTANGIDDNLQSAYTIQLNSFTDQHDAETELADRLQQGLSAYIYPIVLDGKTLFTICTGVYKDQKEAADRAAELHNKMNLDTSDTILVTVRVDKTGQPAPVIRYKPS